jgi:NTE family protein
MSDTGPRTALVLGGGGARGAYEAGALSYLREDLEPRFGPLRIDIVSGTSVGAINACHVASWIDQPRHQARDLVSRWRSLRLHEVLHFGYGDLARIGREMIGGQPKLAERQGGLIDPAGLRRAVLAGIRWREIVPAIREGKLYALVVTATHVRSGKSEVFIQRHGGGLPPLTRDPRVIASAARIGPLHALASAAIPLLFPAVRLRGKLYVDGGLRMNVPLSPALRLGADRVAVISLRHFESPWEQHEGEELEREASVATAPFLIGKTLNALLLDRTDEDIERLLRINSMLEAGVAAYGMRYPDVFNAALLPHRNMGVRYIRNLLVRPSKDIGRLALEYAQTPGFKRRTKGLAARTIGRLADRQGMGDDLISYLLFDGGFADVLIDLGRNDALAQEDEWVRFWSDAPENETEAVQRHLAAVAVGT